MDSQSTSRIKTQETQTELEEMPYVIAEKGMRKSVSEIPLHLKERKMTIIIEDRLTKDLQSRQEDKTFKVH